MEQQKAQQVVQHKLSERDQKLADLEKARRRNPLRGWQPLDALSETLAEVRNRTGLGELSTQADEL